MCVNKRNVILKEQLLVAAYVSDLTWSKILIKLTQAFWNFCCDEASQENVWEEAVFKKRYFDFLLRLVGWEDKCISCHRLTVKCIWLVKRSIWKFDLENCSLIVVEFFVLLFQRDSFSIRRNSYAIFNFRPFLVGFWLGKFPRALTIKIFKKCWDFLNHHPIIKEKNSFE